MELLDGEYVEVLKPVRTSKLKLIQPSELARTVDLAVRLLRTKPSIAGDPELVLILLDADHDAPCMLGPKLLNMARAGRNDIDIACVIANVEYETWFIAAAQSLRDYLDLSRDKHLPDAPEDRRLGKAWIKRRFRKYSETADQPAMTSAMDLAQCRLRSPSFDKLCRDLQARLA
jgi:hypothetical protein